jgi:hypothetical protein
MRSSKMACITAANKFRHSGLDPESRGLHRRFLDSGVRRNDCCVIPGSTRNPEGAFDDRLDSGFRRNDGSSNDVSVQIAPSRVCRFNQVKLPFAMPALDRLLARDGRFHRFVNLVPGQHMNPIFLGESFDKIAPVLPDALYKIRCHADIQRAVSLAGEDIDAGLLHQLSVLDSGIRRNDKPNPVIPGKRSATRNPVGVSDDARGRQIKSLDSGVRRNDGRGGLCRNDREYPR